MKPNLKPFAPNDTVAERFRYVAAVQPEIIAIRDGNYAVSYGELLTRVNAAARHLQDCGIRPGDIVAVQVERSAQMVVALLSALVAGACYVPLDVEMPEARRRHVLKDCSAKAIVSDEPNLRDLEYGQFVIRPNDWPRDGEPSNTAAGAIAYMIYTSGSTGSPKGVPVRNAALSGYMSWCLDNLTFAGGGVPLFGSVAYDHVVTSLFPPLCAGEYLHVIGPLKGGSALASALLRPQYPRSEKYSYVKLTPSHLRMLTQDERAALGSAAHMVVLGGESLQADLVHDLRRMAPQLPVINHYGPTEATVGCCAYNVPLTIEGENIPIGFPMPDVMVEIRDQEGKNCPVGAVGELYIGGPRISDGYWNLPELTSIAFIREPDASGNVVRWYRSGDLVRRRTGGAIEYVRRADDQVKILGYRVEPAEIESAIRGHEAVSAVAVVARGTAWSAELLAAVVISQPIDSERIREHLEMILPAAMIPTRFAFVERLPTNANGKLDRGAILAMFDDQATDSVPDIRDAVLYRWRLILRNPDIEGDEDFFEIGGDSMAALEICLWAMSTFDIELEPTVAFEYPTANSLATHIQTVRDSRLAQPTYETI